MDNFVNLFLSYNDRIHEYTLTIIILYARKHIHVNFSKLEQKYNQEKKIFFFFINYINYQLKIESTKKKKLFLQTTQHCLSFVAQSLKSLILEENKKSSTINE